MKAGPEAYFKLERLSKAGERRVGLECEGLLPMVAVALERNVPKKVKDPFIREDNGARNSLPRLQVLLFQIMGGQCHPRLDLRLRQLGVMLSARVSDSPDSRLMRKELYLGFRVTANTMVLFEFKL